MPAHRAERPSNPDRPSTRAPRSVHRHRAGNLVRRRLTAGGVALAAAGGLMATVGASAAPEADEARGSAALLVASTSADGSGDEARSARIATMRSERSARLSRSADRLKAERRGAQRRREAARARALASADPRSVARAMLPEFGFGTDQFGCLDALWTRESGWNVHADNPSSSAYGIPQALPGEKMASAGADWSTSAATQIRWGLGYIRDSYGSPCGAWSHSESDGWY